MAEKKISVRMEVQGDGQVVAAFEGVSDKHQRAILKVIAAENDLVRQQRESAASLEAEKRAFDALRASVDPAHAAQRRYEQAVEAANRAVREGAATQEQANAVMLRARTAYLGAATGAENLARNAGAFNSRQISLQLSQVAQQGAATGNYLQALAIQLPDIAMFMGGTFAIMAGVAAGALLPFAANLLSSGEATEAAKKAQEEWQGSLSAASSAIARADQAAQLLGENGLKALRDRYGEVTMSVQELAAALADIEARAATVKVSEVLGDATVSGFAEAFAFGNGVVAASILDATAEDLAAHRAELEALRIETENLRALGQPTRASENLLRNMEEELAALEGRYQDMGQLAEDLGPSLEQVARVRELQAAYDEALNAQDFATVADVLRDMQRLAEETGVEMDQGILDKMTQAEDVARQFAARIGDATDETITFSSVMSTAAGSAKSLSGWLERSLGYANAMASVEMSWLDKAMGWVTGFGRGAVGGMFPSVDMTTLDQPRSQFERDGVSPDAIRALAALEQLAGRAFTINSAHRSAAENEAAGGANRSQHIHGNAFDVNAIGMSIAERVALIQQARSVGFGGVGVYQNTLHFDVGPTRAWGPDYTSRSIPAWAVEAVQASRGYLPGAAQYAGSGTSRPRARGQGEVIDLRQEARLAETEARAAEAEARRQQLEADKLLMQQAEDAAQRYLGTTDALIAARQEFIETERELGEQLKAGLITADEYGEAWAEAKRKLDATTESAKLTTDQLQQMNQFAKTAFSDILSGLRQGAEAGDILATVLDRVVDRMLDLAAQDFANAFAPTDGSEGVGGSIFGNLLRTLLGWDSGGYTGDGGRLEPAGIVHKGEYVMSAAAVRTIGVGALEQLHQAALSGKGYADGGYAGLDGMTAVRAASRSVSRANAGAQAAGGGKIQLDLRTDPSVIVGIAQNTAGAMIRQSLSAYDEVLPARVSQIAADPKVR